MSTQLTDNATATDAHLLKTLARATGWRLFRACGYPVGLTGPTIQGHMLFQTEAEALDIIRANNPDWLHSVDAALSLPWPTPHKLKITVEVDYAEVSLYGRTVSEAEFLGTEYAPTLARALCEVFAAWWESTQEKEAE